MQMFFFIQHLSFSPLRMALQDEVLKLCSERISWDEFRDRLWARFPEYQTHFDRCLETAKRSLVARPVPALRLIYGASDFPQQLTHLMDPPWTLTVLGSTRAFHQPLLSVIGSREPTDESIQWMETELAGFPERGWAFASGGARGIDQRAHLLCLRKNKPTLIFLPSGISTMYPQNLLSWRESVLQSQSGFVSEFPDDYPMRKYSFAFRNRLMAALGSGLLVVQAGEKSGTLMTAHLALEMGRPVYVLPAHPVQRHYRGNLKLPELGAQFIYNAEDLSGFIESERPPLSLTDTF